MKDLRPFQQEAVELLKVNARYGIFHDCGLGKTRIVMEDLKRCPASKYILWVTKASLRTATVYEWAKWGGPPSLIRVLKGEPQPGINVVSHQYMARDKNIALLLRYDWTVIIVDEAHRFKNWESKSTRNLILKVGRTAKVVRLMTATPYVKSAADLHPLLSFLQPGKWGRFKDFAEKYANKVDDRFSPTGSRYDGVSQMFATELAEHIKSVSTRKTRNEVGDQLPKTQHISVYLELPDGDAGLDSEEHKKKILNGDFSDEETVGLVRQIGLSKVPLVMDWLEDQEHRPTLLATWFRDVAETYKVQLEKAGHRVGLIYGGVPEAVRVRLCEQFQNGQLDYLVCAIAAAGEGLNLDKAERVVFAENPWSYTDRHQMLSRAVRMTTVHSVAVYTMMLADTLDEIIVQVAQNKKKGAEDIGLGI